ncbi:M56 family metallopeptidase [Streptosporangium soli]|nr:M56 family metallopeptidase [Streptosporangium sp. KLBMP 9127]
MTPWLIAASVALAPIVLGGRLARGLATARWASHHPRAALTLWQAIGLAGGLGAVGVGLVAAVAPLAAAFPHGMHTLGHQVLDGSGFAGLGMAHIAALLWSAALIAWLASHTAHTTVKTIREQRRQRLLLDVLADHSPEHDAYVLPSPKPTAYCVPGWPPRIVLSRGTLNLLDPAELQAVLAHERAHAAGRHDLLLLPFIAIARAFPWVPAARTARTAVPVLLEMIADDQARRAQGDRVLAHAILNMIESAGGPAATLALADSAVLQRVERLLRASEQERQWVPAAAYSTAAALLSGPLAVMVAPMLCGILWPV